MAVYALSAYLTNFLDELAPIYASAPFKVGGLQLPTIKLAWSLSFGGVCVVVISVFMYPRIQRVIGPLRASRYGMLLMIPGLALLPCTSLVAHNFWAVQVGLPVPCAE